MMKRLKKIPKFKNENEEAQFWLTHNSTEYVNWDKAETAMFPDLQASTKMISLRISENLLDEIKHLAKQKKVAYQSLIKKILAEGVRHFQAK